MTVDELQVLITANTSALQKEIGRTNSKIDSLKKSATKTQSGVSSAFKKLKTGIVALGIGKVIKDSISSGMNAIESDNLFEVSLGNMADSVREWSEEVGNALGLSAVEMRKNVGTIYNMTTSMGIAEKNALKMSKGMTLLANDMASFYNLSTEEAFTKLSAGITGETEPLKRLGILVDENTIKQVAYQQGIAQTGSELTQQQKVLARYVAILQQTGNAQGDLARTLDSPSNQLRQLRSQVEQLGIAFGNFFMPILQAVIPYITAFAKVVTYALNSLGKFLGFTSSGATQSMAKDIGKVSSGLGGVNTGLDNANKSAKKLKGNLSGFDEMNVVQDNSSSGAGGGAGGGGASAGLDFDLGDYDAHLEDIDSKVDKIAKNITKTFSKIGKGINWSNLTNSFNNVKNALAPITATIFEGLKWAWDNLLVPLAQWTIGEFIPAFLNNLAGTLDFLAPIIEDAKDVIIWLWDSFLKPVASWTGGVIVDILNGVGDALSWIGKNQIAVAILEGLAIAIGLVTGALKLWNIAVGVWNSIGAVATTVTTAFNTAVSVLTSPITIVIGVIAGLTAAIILLIKNWDTVKAVASDVWNKIKSVWGVVANWFKDKIVEPVKNFFNGMWDKLKNGASNAWAGIKSVFSRVGEFFGNTFSNAWEKVKNVFSKGGKIFSGIKDGIVEAFKKIVNTLIGGINNVIKVPFDKINEALNSVRNFSIFGGHPFGGIPSIGVPQIPELARGGVVDNPTIAMIGEAGKEAVVPLENNTGWIDKLADKLGDKMGANDQPIQLVVKIGEDTIAEKFIQAIRDKSFETNGEVFSI